MSPDEKSLPIAQTHLKPGESLLWSGPASAKPRGRDALRIAAIPFLSCLLFGALP